MGITVVIPARYGSTRFPGKPLCQLAGRTMIEWVCRRAAQARDVGRVVVATDDDRILDAVIGFGGRAVLTTGRFATGSDRVAAAVQDMGLNPDDLVINLQGDQPLFNPRCLDQVVEPLKNEPDLVMSTLVYPITDPGAVQNPNNVKTVLDLFGNALYFSRGPIPFGRDETPDQFHKHLGIYAFRKSFLDKFTALPPGRLEQIEKLEQLRALEHGYPIRCVITEHDSPEVDTPADVARVSEMIEVEGRES
ncbi:MAG: 3-deoxy-manno-octulosonate cytidylyltransferase [Proteobacteria bacterium]|nr:3-deoxy-manno-octulosonate cytidylyltransferase [Pseudomonadota bacterium]